MPIPQNGQTHSNNSSAKGLKLNNPLYHDNIPSFVIDQKNQVCPLMY